MDKYNGETKYITGYDGKQHKTTFKPAPSEVEIKRRPTESMLWQMRHKPYGIGGDANAGRTENRE